MRAVAPVRGSDVAEEGAQKDFWDSDVVSGPPPTGRQAAWNYLVFGLSKSSTLIMTVVVARLLSPADFGLFALALLIVNLFDYTKDLGVGAALVQSPREWHRFAPTGLTLTVIFGVIVGAALAVTAPLTAALADHSALTPLIRVLAVALVVISLSAIPAARLRRNLDFRSRLIPEFLGALVKTVSTIALALAGFGVWSLVYGQLAASVVITVGYWWVGRSALRSDGIGALRLGFVRDEAVPLIRFGIPVTVIALLGFAAYNVDYLAIAIRLGDGDLGLYTLAYRLPELIVLNLCIVISEVLFSSLSRLQGDREALAAHFFEVMTAVVALTAPIGIALAVTASPLVATLYGPEYAGAAPVLAVLSLYAVIHSASFHAGDVFKAINRPSLLTSVTAGKLVLMVGPIWWAAKHGIVAVAWVLLAVEIVHCLLKLIIAWKVIGLSMRRLMAAAFRPIPAAVGMGLVMLGVLRAVDVLIAPLIVAVTMIAGVMAYSALMRLTAPDLFAAAVGSVQAALGRKAINGKKKVAPPTETSISTESRYIAGRPGGEDRIE